MNFQTGSWPPPTASGPWGYSPTPGASGGPQLPQLDPHTGLPTGAQHRDLRYHRLALSDFKHRRWSPVAEGGALAIAIFIVSIIFFLILFVTTLIIGYEDLLNQLGSGQTQNFDVSDPWVFLALFGSIAIWVPLILGIRWLLRPRPVGLIWSVAGRIRWKWLIVTAGVAVAAFLLVYGVVGLLELIFGETDTPPTSSGSRHSLWWLSLGFALIVVPLQCTAEELLFRGYMAQAIGRWLKNPAWAIVLPAPLFMLGHMYDLWGQLFVFSMACVAGVLTWRTGGLEAAISLHVVNNMVAVGSSLLWPIDPNSPEASVGFQGFAAIIVLFLVYTVAVLVLGKRMGIETSRRAVVWPKKYQDAWYAQVRAVYAAQGIYGGVPAAMPGVPAPPVQPLVPVTIPVSMAYATPDQIAPDGTLRLVPADGLVAYAAPEQQLIPGSDPPVYAHPVVWMARTSQPQASEPPQPVVSEGQA